MKDFNIVASSNVSTDDTTMELYKVLPNSQIVGLISC